MNAKDAIANKKIASEHAQQLVIRLCELMVKYNFELWAEYIDTKANELADSLSRLQIYKFKTQCQKLNYIIDPSPLCLVRIPFEPGKVDNGPNNWQTVEYA